MSLDTYVFLVVILFSPLQFEKKRQMEFQRVHTLNLMLEKEQRFVEALRSELAKSNDSKLQEQLVGAERRVQTVQQQLLNLSNAESEVSHVHTALFTIF